MMRILTTLSLVLFCLAYFESGYCETKKAVKPLNGETVQFHSYDELNPAQKKLADKVYQLERREFNVPEKMSEEDSDHQYGLARKDMQLGFVNLNNDKSKDMIAMPGRISCGTGGCALKVFLAPRFQRIDIEESAFLNLPVKVLPHKTNGLHDILINKQDVCTFNPHRGRYFCK